MLGPEGSKSGGGGGLSADSEKREEPILGDAGLLPLERLPLRLFDLLAMWTSSWPNDMVCGVEAKKCEVRPGVMGFDGPPLRSAELRNWRSLRSSSAGKSSEKWKSSYGTGMGGRSEALSIVSVDCVMASADVDTEAGGADCCAAAAKVDVVGMV